MATRKRTVKTSGNGTSNGNGGGHSTGSSNGHGLAFDPVLVLTHARDVAASAESIARGADDVSVSAVEQIRIMDDAVSGLGVVAASLKQTAGQAESVSTATEEL